MGSVADKNGNAKINISKSKIKTGNLTLSGWKRSSTIHTHPRMDALNFSDDPYTPVELGGGADVQWALDRNVKLYLTTSYDNFAGVFNPIKYRERFKKYTHEQAVHSAKKRSFYVGPGLGPIKYKF